MKTGYRVCIGVVMTCLALTACGEGGQDAPVDTRDTSGATVMNFPDGFRNVAHKCDGPNMVYSASSGNDTRSGSVAVVANDPRCAKG